MARYDCEFNARATRELGKQLGWTLVHAEASSVAEWDAFESSFLRSAEVELAEHSDSDDALAHARHWRSWNSAYQTWGRDTLGFYVCELRTGPAA